MSKKCSICEHEQLEQINMELMSGVSLRTVAKKFNVSHSALHRHKCEHIPHTEETPSALPVVSIEKVAELERRANVLYLDAMHNDDRLNAIRALKEYREIVSLYAKLTGELTKQTQIVHNHLHISPEWISLRQTMLSALAPFPEARAALISAISAAEAQEAYPAETAEIGGGKNAE